MPEAKEVGDRVGEAVGEGFSAVLGSIESTWRYEITTIEGQGITVGASILAIVLVLVGYWLSRRVSRALGQLLVRRLKLESGPASAIETLGFYVLFVAVAISALRMVNFPLTAFTIAGGAIAIGVGFGSQNVMNNFISGLILMLERPVRVGDLIRVSDTYGTVEHIGARSTQVRASDNTQLIVPNSFFLENTIVNFTLSDDVVRTQINIGVIYGSPTRDAERIIREVLDEHPKILREIPPRIIFADFGDNALMFEVYYWVRARSILDRKQVESEIRFRIDDLYRAAGITIAFPQRDVHLYPARPIEVRLRSDTRET